MFVEVITIGDELLIGQVVDTNSAWIGQQLNESGFEVIRRTSVRDREEEIRQAVEGAFNSEADIVLVTGGLGPTKDDITLKTLCAYFQDDLIFNQDVYDNVCAILGKSHIQMVARNKSQAMVPAHADVIMNSVGTAPITWFNKAGKVLVSMPGVPQEMKEVMRNKIIPRLQKEFKVGVILHSTHSVINYPESLLADKIAIWEDQLPKEISLAYLPQQGIVRLRLTARGEDKVSLQEKLEEETKKLFKLLGKDIFPQDNAAINELIQEEMVLQRATLSTAESCTGGSIGQKLTAIPGSSRYYKGGVICYSNALKEKVLGVPKDILERFGAVSEETVVCMANGALKSFNTDYAIATTGIAGPGGGSIEKPVGTVWIGVASKNETITKKIEFDRGREQNIIRSTNNALLLLYKTLLEIKNK